MAFDIAAYIDHTILKPDTTPANVDKVCEEAATQHFAAVCIPVRYVARAKKILQERGVKVATVVAFPDGTGSPGEKRAEIMHALAEGADEIDMVIDIAALKQGDVQHLEAEIVACLEPVKAQHKVIKVIVESGILTDEELLACCEVYSKYPIDYMKTSTGFAKTGATVHAVELMRANLPASISIKASGGIRDYTFAKELIDAGATRLGTSAGMQLMNEAKSDQIDN
ncbi:MAG: deoxyribose-phosphate aldolase [Flavipsychrobacter sp.]|nr:deoxyribose-phosphate aldolase [Flavipsychrobacter sp.]